MLAVTWRLPRILQLHIAPGDLRCHTDVVLFRLEGCAGDRRVWAILLQLTAPTRAGRKHAALSELGRFRWVNNRTHNASFVMIYDHAP